jgi:uncharacterized membrane protein (UPF0127 family)
MSRRHFLQPLVNADGTLPLYADGHGEPVATALEGAFDSAARKRGLLGRDALPDAAGLAIAPCSGIHTFGMRFPIDVIFAARDGRVLKILAAVPPRRIAVALRAFAAVELAAGAADRSRVQVGDRLIVGDRPCGSMKRT